METEVLVFLFILGVVSEDCAFVHRNTQESSAKESLSILKSGCGVKNYSLLLTEMNCLRSNIFIDAVVYINVVHRERLKHFLVSVL